MEKLRHIFVEIAVWIIYFIIGFIIFYLELNILPYIWGIIGFAIPYEIKELNDWIDYKYFNNIPYYTETEWRKLEEECKKSEKLMEIEDKKREKIMDEIRVARYKD